MISFLLLAALVFFTWRGYTILQKTLDYKKYLAKSGWKGYALLAFLIPAIGIAEIAVRLQDQITKANQK